MLEGERIFLKPLSLKDAEQYTKLGGSLAYSNKSIKDLKKAKKWIKTTSWKKDSCYYGIFLKEHNLLIGEFELCHMSWWYDKAGEIGYFIRKEFRGKGYATEASKIMINYCFNKLKFHKIYADTDPDNLASQKVLEKLGFKLEGKNREKIFMKGKWIDEYNFGLLKSEWKK